MKRKKGGPYGRRLGGRGEVGEWGLEGPSSREETGRTRKIKTPHPIHTPCYSLHGHFNRREGEREGVREDRETHLESLCVAATEGEGERVSTQNCRTSSSRRNDSLSSGVEVLDLLDDGLEGREPVSELVGNCKRLTRNGWRGEQSVRFIHFFNNCAATPETRTHRRREEIRAWRRSLLGTGRPSWRAVSPIGSERREVRDRSSTCTADTRKPTQRLRETRTKKTGLTNMLWYCLSVPS